MSWDIVDFCPSRVWYRTFQNLRFNVFGGGHFMRTFNCSRSYIMKLFTWMAQVFKWVFQFLIWFIQYIRYGMFQYFEFTKWGPFQVSIQKKNVDFLLRVSKCLNPIIWNILREKCPNMEFFLWSEYRKIRARKKLRIWTLFMQWQKQGVEKVGLCGLREYICIIWFSLFSIVDFISETKLQEITSRAIIIIIAYSG